MRNIPSSYYLIFMKIIHLPPVLMYLVFMRVSAHSYMPAYISSLEDINIEIIGGFLSFFLIFFVNDSNNRFKKLYLTSMSCEGRIFDAAALARTTLPCERASHLIRYMNAAHISGFMGLSSTYVLNIFLSKSTKLITS